MYEQGKTINIKLPETLKIIGYLSGCGFLREIEIPDSVERIEGGAFDMCKDLATVKINNTSNLKYIGPGAFSFCALTEINIPSGIEYIGKGAFCYNDIKSVKIPKRILDIGYLAWNAFSAQDYPDVRYDTEIIYVE